MADFATWQDVQDRWRTLSPDEQTRATTNIADASAIIRSVIPDIDARIEADTAEWVAAGNTGIGNLGRTALRIVADAVIRVMTNPDGARRVQETIGDKAYTLDYGEGRVSGLFLTDTELGPLQPSGGDTGGEAIGTAIVNLRDGWAPASPPTVAGWWPVG